MEHYASIYAFVKNFMKCDSISTVRQTAVVRLATDQCCARVVDAISIVSFAFTLTQRSASTIYEDKDA
jgi:hypothetical protein